MKYLFFVFLFLLGCSSPKGKKVVHLAIWSRYLPEDFAVQFQEKTGIELLISHYSSNEEVLAKMQAGFKGFDVVVPTDYMVGIMRAMELLSALDLKKIPHLQGVSERFLNQEFDLKNQYSVPYNWSTTGIAVNRDLYKGKLTSWVDLLSRPELEKKVSLLDDSREVIGIALKVLGQSFNTVDPNALQNAKKWLFSVRNRIKMFTSEPVMALANGEFFASHVYSSDAMYMKYRLKKNIEYFFPEEGFVWSIDCLVIPQNAQHKEEAYVLIDYLLGLTMSVHLTQTVFLSPVNLNVVDYITPEIKSEPAIFPSPGVMSKAELIRDTQSATVLYDRIWTEVKSKTD